MDTAVVSILPMFVGSGRTIGLLRACPAAVKPGWLLRESATAVAATGTITALPTTIASAAAIVGRVLLMWWSVDAGWGLLANSHAELLDVCQLALHSHSGQAGCLGLDRFLRSCAVPKFTNNLLYNASNLPSSMAAIP